MYTDSGIFCKWKNKGRIESINYLHNVVKRYEGTLFLEYFEEDGEIHFSRPAGLAACYEQAYMSMQNPALLDL